jgi:hypothetical protein
MWKYAVAFLLGLLSFIVFMFVGETAGLPAAFAELTVYFCLCQHLLSFRRADARLAADHVDARHRAVAPVLPDRRNREAAGISVRRPADFLLTSCAGTYLSAVLTSVTAGRKRRAVVVDV